MDKLLQVEHLNTYFPIHDGRLHAVCDVSFHVNKGELLAIVGESGCGKSVTALSVIGLLPHRCKVESEGIFFEGSDIGGYSHSQMRRMRGKEISMIFQEPLTSLNPLFTIGFQLMETIRLHDDSGREKNREKALEILRKVEIARPEAILRSFPNELSGGMRQRVMIAIALVNHPKLIIADEPTTALDVTIQAQILALMKHLMAEYRTSIMFITHDLGVVAEVADRVLVMYAGQVVEEATVEELFREPMHPYTQGLMNSTIRIDQEEGMLPTIDGVVPTLAEMPDGCRFHPRCPHAKALCRSESPDVRSLGARRRVRCHMCGGVAALPAPG
ncbi:MAG: ABC transporter ATP-binding protein [Lachnospiraceae bacterium]|jgi:oligopeptide/dipeptide ABC transporter ATP-binding protein|nr:ABC transporter ATP-binding protein [Lachnospiraceae bacterium]